jgi:CO/xanthine dehydrogenase Mo-binding subunit
MGDVEKGFAEADAVIEGSCGYDNIPNPIPMESPAAVAFWEEPYKVTVWVSNQAVWLNKNILSVIFGDKVQVRTSGSLARDGHNFQAGC